MAQRNFTIRALGEIAIRCVDLDAMVAFTVMSSDLTCSMIPTIRALYSSV